jgi:hypothetical protein
MSSELSYQAELVAKYRAVHTRLWGTKKSCRLPMPVAPKVAPPIPKDEVVTSGAALRAAICTLKDLTPLTCAACLVAASQATGIAVADIRGPRRLRNIVIARHLFFWLAVKYTKSTLPSIGRFVGHNDHSSVFHAVYKITDNPKIWEGLVEKAEGFLKSNEGVVKP